MLNQDNTNVERLHLRDEAVLFSSEAAAQAKPGGGEHPHRRWRNAAGTDRAGAPARTCSSGGR